ncbi:tetratricopeptide repeat-containing sensor histidine kinase [Haliscomenobacter sp.]|uniref:tetratricopeptide repeat-containing sensor histidine kinase n=1 Tax=Haliscomenobacter sp. TaxID=2717303 RepID=UPI003BAB9F6E
MNPRLILVLAALILGLAQPLHAQLWRQRDSLLRISRQHQLDTTGMLALMDAGKLYLEYRADSAEYFIRKALDKANTLQFGSGIARAEINLGYALINQAKYDQAYEHTQKGLSWAKKEGAIKLQVAALVNTANIWLYRGSNFKVIEAYEQALELVHQHPEVLPPHYPLAIQNNLAMVYNGISLYREALKVLRQTLKKGEEGEIPSVVVQSLQHHAEAYRGLQKQDSAIWCYEKLIPMCKNLGENVVLAGALSNLADIKMQQGQIELSKRYYQESLNLTLQTQDGINQMYALHGLGLVALNEGKWNEAENYVKSALKLGIEQKAGAYTFALYQTLSYLALARGQIDQYRQYFSLYKSGRDSVQNEKLIRVLQDLETKYETKEKELRIVQLTQMQENQRRLALGAFIFAILIGIVGWLAWRNQHNRKKLAEQALLLQEQKIKELEQEKQLLAADAMLKGQEEERRRLSRDLHDGLGGMLSGIKQSLVVIKSNPEMSEQSSKSIGRTIESMDQSINEMRRLARNLMPEALLKFGLKDALQDFCDYLSNSTQMQIQYQTFGIEQRIPEGQEVIVFRIVQELLNNVVKHAKASMVLLQLLRDGQRFSLTVEDNGVGIPGDTLDKAQGIGWTNIRSRVDYLNGQLDIRSKPGQGTSINIDFVLN